MCEGCGCSTPDSPFMPQGVVPIGKFETKAAVAFFTFDNCEHCYPQLAGLQDKISGLVDSIDSEALLADKAACCDIAFIEGSVSSVQDKQRLVNIRSRAKILVALGTCNAETIQKLVRVDTAVHGCPFTPSEFIKVVKALVFGTTPDIPEYPVCMECKMAGAICMFDKDDVCLGPVSRAGCDALCPVNHIKCVGCRGLARNANIIAMEDVLAKSNKKIDDIKRKSALFSRPAETSK